MSLPLSLVYIYIYETIFFSFLQSSHIHIHIYIIAYIHAYTYAQEWQDKDGNNYDSNRQELVYAVNAIWASLGFIIIYFYPIEDITQKCTSSVHTLSHTGELRKREK